MLTPAESLPSNLLKELGMKQGRISLLLAILCLLPGSLLLAQDPGGTQGPVQAHPEGDAAIGSLKSPYCPGLMLEVCPTPDAKKLRDTLQVMAHGGLPADSIVNWMLANFGEEYRAVPKTLVAWIMPPLAIVLGFLLIVLALKHFRSRQGPESPDTRTLTPEDESVVAEALQELKAAEEVPF